MDFIRRAWLFTKAKIGRTILLIVAFSAILIFVLSGLIINSAANVSIDNAKKSAGATVSLSVNMQNVIKEAQNSAISSSSSSSSSDTAEAGKRFNIDLPTISETTAEKIAKLDGVKSASFTYQAQASASSGIEKVSTSSSSSSSSTDTQAAGGVGGREGGMGGGSQEDFTISGTNDLAASTSFTDSYKISSGRAIKASDEGTNNVVIESTLASQNSLKVGSTFTIKDSNDKTYKMTVVGIYTTTSSSTESSIQYMNTMYTALSVANSIKGTTGKVSNATYSMENPAQADTFVKAANKLVNDSNYQAYQNVKSSLNNVASFARNIVLIVAIAGAIILELIVMLMVRERRFEIGVLMSLGESKLKIIGQFFFELFMVMIVSVGIASAAGNVVGNVVGQQLLKQETTQTTASTSNMQGAPGANGGKTEGQRPSENAGGFMGRAGGAIGFGQSASEAKALEKLNIKTSVSEILLLVAIAILITLIAVGLASIGILRLNPKQVLTN